MLSSPELLVSIVATNEFASSIGVIFVTSPFVISYPMTMSVFSIDIVGPFGVVAIVDSPLPNSNVVSLVLDSVPYRTFTVYMPEDFHNPPPDVSSVENLLSSLTSICFTVTRFPFAAITCRLTGNPDSFSLTSPVIFTTSPLSYDSLSVVTTIGSIICAKVGVPLMLAIKIANTANIFLLIIVNTG